MAIDPHYVYALNNKGISLDNLGNHSGSLLFFDKTLAIDPHNIKALGHKGAALDNLGNHSGAMEYYDKGIG